MSQQERAVVDAVLYAMRTGALFPVKFPARVRGHYRTADLIKWGAMRYLHDAVAELSRGAVLKGEATSPSGKEQ